VTTQELVLEALKTAATDAKDSIRDYSVHVRLGEDGLWHVSIPGHPHNIQKYADYTGESLEKALMALIRHSLDMLRITQDQLRCQQATLDELTKHFHSVLLGSQE